MKALGWIALAVASVAAVWYLVRRALLARLSRSPTAEHLGIDNTPTGKAVTRLLYIAPAMDSIRGIVRQAFPLARVSSCYRCEALNAAVGGSPTSRHLYGLGVDFGGIGDGEATLFALEIVRSQVDQVTPRPRDVLAEADHLHIDFYDPLGELDGPESEWRATRWRKELPSGQFASL